MSTLSKDQVLALSPAAQDEYAKQIICSSQRRIDLHAAIRPSSWDNMFDGGAVIVVILAWSHLKDSRDVSLVAFFILLSIHWGHSRATNRRLDAVVELIDEDERSSVLHQDQGQRQPPNKETCNAASGAKPAIPPWNQAPERMAWSPRFVGG